MKIIGHRGAAGLAPEHTRASITKALDHNVDEIECDVRVTEDGVPILAHDIWLRTPDGSKLRIAGTPYADLLKHKPDLLTLDEALQVINRQVPLLIEVKPREDIEPITTCLNEHLFSGWQPTDFLLGSRSYRLLKRFHELLPAIPLVVIEPWSGVRATSRARRLGTKRLSMNYHWLWFGFIRAMQRQGYQLCAYTINKPGKARSWQRHGLYGIFTDYPDLF